MDYYSTFTLRNADYISPEAQERIRNSVLLIAGCGIGSSFAEVAVRLGFEHLILADADIVSAHNLNRQNYIHSDIGNSKATALAGRLNAINPNASIEVFEKYLDEENVSGIVSKADFVFDTIDFLDLVGIVALHDECRKQATPIITALAIGWGAGCVYFPQRGEPSFRTLFRLPETGSVRNENYAEKFAFVMERLGERLDPVVASAVAKALTIMEDGTPCPASQVSPGAYAVGSLAGTIIVRIIAGLEVKPAPELLVIDMPTVSTGPGILLS